MLACAYTVSDFDNYDDGAEAAGVPLTLHNRLWQEKTSHTVAKPISRRLISWWDRALDILFPSSFEYTPIEMDDRSLGPSGITGSKIETTNGRSTSMMEDKSGQPSARNIVSSEGVEPTEEEVATLRKVADRLPWSAFIVALVELCERFTYYGLSGPFQNYIQYHPHDTPVRGGIGMVL